MTLNLWDALILLFVGASAFIALRRIARRKRSCGCDTGCGGDCAACACACNRREKRQ